MIPYQTAMRELREHFERMSIGAHGKAQSQRGLACLLSIEESVKFLMSENERLKTGREHDE